MAAVITKENIQEIIARDGLEQTTKKTIRHALEKKAKVKRDKFVPMKKQISEIVDEIMEEFEEIKGDEKKPRESEADVATTEKQKSFSCVTRSGTECPKNIKQTQAKIKLTVQEFLASNKRMTIDVDGNILSGDPRAFASGNLGWYLTGKIELDVDDKKIWAQVGMNITIPGSQSWEAH